MVAELTRELGLFNSLNGLMATVISLGNVASPVVVGVLVQQAGFAAGFWGMALLATLAAGLFGYLLWAGGGNRPAREPASSEEAEDRAA